MPRTDSGMRYNKTKTTRSGRQYMTCWMVEIPNKDGNGSHYYGKIVSKNGKVIALSSTGESVSLENKKGEVKNYLAVDVFCYSQSKASSSGMNF